MHCSNSRGLVVHNNLLRYVTGDGRGDFLYSSTNGATWTSVLYTTTPDDTGEYRDMIAFRGAHNACVDISA